jgi:hypothetical protein
MAVVWVSLNDCLNENQIQEQQLASGCNDLLSSKTCFLFSGRFTGFPRTTRDSKVAVSDPE